MNTTTVAVDLAKSVFQLAVADASWKVVETHRLTRAQFERWLQNRSVGLVVMEACGSAHHWARWLNRMGIEVRLLPAAYTCADNPGGLSTASPESFAFISQFLFGSLSIRFDIASAVVRQAITDELIQIVHYFDELMIIYHSKISSSNSLGANP